MWNPVDPDEPTSELYRLMPPRRRSELREVLDDAAGGAERGDSAAPAAAARGARRTIGSFLGSVTANALGGILAAGGVALIVYLWVHFH
jgi:hypothetical protein